MTKRLFVGNLPYSVEDAALLSAFQSQGFEVASARVVLDRETGRSRGFAFVDVEADDMATSAIQKMDGFEIQGRKMRVTEAEERRPRPARGPGAGPPSGGYRGGQSGGGHGRGGGPGRGRDDRGRGGGRDGPGRDFGGGRDSAGRGGGKKKRRDEGGGADSGWRGGKFFDDDW